MRSLRGIDKLSARIMDQSNNVMVNTINSSVRLNVSTPSSLNLANKRMQAITCGKTVCGSDDIVKF